MYCENCGNKINENSKFCNYCGGKIIHEKNSQTVGKVHIESEEDHIYIWTCDYCGKEFETKIKSDNHEKICDKNPINFKNLCPSCGIENKKEALFCKKCGDNLSGYRNKDRTDGIILDEKDERYKKIKNAGTTGEALGWFNLILGPIIIISNSAELESGFFIVDLIYFLIVSFIFIKFGKKLKKVTNASLKDIMVLLWTSIFVVFVNLLSALVEGGNFVGFLFFFELYYLLQARKILKNLDHKNNS